jgi:hypothetical protein
MPSPSLSAKLRTKTSYQVRSFQSCASGLVAGVHAAPADEEADAEGDDAAEDDADAEPDGVGDAGPHAPRASRHASARGTRGIGRRTAAVYPRPGRPPGRPTIDWRP